MSAYGKLAAASERFKPYLTWDIRGDGLMFTLYLSGSPIANRAITIFRTKCTTNILKLKRISHGSHCSRRARSKAMQDKHSEINKTDVICAA